MEHKHLLRLLRSLIPFTAMVLVQSIASLALVSLGDAGALIGFMLASAAVIGLSRVKFFRLTDENEDEDNHVSPMTRTGGTPLRILLYTLLSVAVLILVMYFTSSSLKGYSIYEPNVNALSVISLIIVHPALEEIIFRGYFYRMLRPMSQVFAVLMQAVMFALVHDSIGSILFALGAGVVLCFAVEKTGKIYSSLIAHAVINLRSLLYLSVLEESPLRDAIDIVLVVAGFISLVVLLILRRARINAQEAAEEAEDEAE